MNLPSAEAFVDVLDRAPRGRPLLVNAWDSMRTGLVTRQFLREFFERCAQDPCAAEDPLKSVKQVCLGFSNGMTGPLVRHSKCPAAADDGRTWSTVQSYLAWYHVHVDREAMYTDHGLAIQATPPDGDADQLAAVIDSVTSLDPWWQASTATGGAWLGGNPSSRQSCWVSTNDIDDDHPIDPADLSGTALQVQHALGLYHPARTWLLHYSFDAEKARLAAVSDVARPVFVDLGNSRFRVRHRTARARHYARKRWGTTGHLGAPPPGRMPRDHAGRPERVVRGLSIGELSNLRVRVIGQVDGSPNTGTDDEIVEWLCKPRKVEKIIERLKRLCREVPP